MSNPSVLSTHAKERSTYVITVAFTDDEGAAVTPTSATWTLTDLDGNVINERSAVAITPLSTSATIVLTGDDLVIGTYGEERELLVQAVYDSDLGDDLTNNQAVRFVIDGFVAVT